jgi:nucleotide-binding universal stress UspA family protein
MSKTILCAIDFSEDSKETLRWAATMAVSLQAHLTILYVYRLIKSGDGEVMQLKKKLEEAAYRKFEILEKEILIPIKNSYDFVMEVGFVYDRIEDHTKKQSILLLVTDKSLIAANQENLEDIVNHIQVPLAIIPTPINVIV